MFWLIHHSAMGLAPAMAGAHVAPAIGKPRIRRIPVGIATMFILSVQNRDKLARFKLQWFKRAVIRDGLGYGLGPGARRARFLWLRRARFGMTNLHAAFLEPHQTAQGSISGDSIAKFHRTFRGRSPTIPKFNKLIA